MEQLAVPQQGDIHQARIGRVEDGSVLTPASSANYGHELVTFHGTHGSYYPVDAGWASGGARVMVREYGGHGYSSLMPINAETLFIRLEINWCSSYVSSQPQIKEAPSKHRQAN